MNLTKDQQVKILEVLQYAQLLPARPASDIITPNKVYYSPTMATLLNQDLSERQHTEVLNYLSRIDTIDVKETESIERMSTESIGRGDIQFRNDEPQRLRRARYLAVQRIKEIMGLPDKWAYYAEFR